MKEYDPYVIPNARRYRDRLRQILRYLVGHWPASKPVKLTVRRIGVTSDCRGFTDLDPSGRGLVIVLDNRLQFSYAIDTMLHEWAHAVSWSVRGDHHGPAWAGVYASICTAFEDGEALEDSLDW